MDQETQPGEGPVDETTGTPQFGPILETLDARITIRYPFDRTEDDEAAAKTMNLTNIAVAMSIQAALEDHIAGSVGDGLGFTVRVTVEKV